MHCWFTLIWAALGLLFAVCGLAQMHAPLPFPAH
jgi:hypothetical protein